ncbi:PTS system mannose/fructose/sorbose family transporter subunit IID [Bacillus sp. ISL-18]|uniref:PTS system mannose/fructose/sorbose family transporter subunit IID n=1 Tax=Bacillus sp. ISL-18 TaxID=2819118 RepID=UPI001BEBACCC|nr:PTS system mannose/fructose/sorbose family transporter subunit IID [Bacillus sp. ISL-18]MBT2655266.1 PTS system mannose/fructose/sorbose family transporter subunit IID [Bacillus sp. ISL-18]
MTEIKVTKKELRQVFWRSLALQGAFNYERMQNMGYVYAMIPVIKKLYTQHDDQVKALNRHLEIFNTTPAISTTIMGISAAMEEQNANNEDFDDNSINAVKASLMGPLAGIGDSLFWGTFRVIAAGIGISLATKGNIFGPILFFLLYNIPHLFVRIAGLRLGYRVGVSSLEKIQKEGLMEKIMAIATTIGLVVVGGMVATMLNVKTPLHLNINGAKVVVQDILNQIFPNMLPLLITFVVFTLMKRKVSITKLTLGIIIGGILIHWAGIL